MEEPYFGSIRNRRMMETYQISASYLYTNALNECLRNHPEVNTREILRQSKVEFAFSQEEFYVCLTGLKKSIYFSVYGCDATSYMEIYDKIRRRLVAIVAENGYCADIFMVMREDVKQIAIFFTPGEGARCTPSLLARELGHAAQRIYEELLFKGDTRYCNVTALSQSLSGFGQIREGYLQAQQLNDLSFFHMDTRVLTKTLVDDSRNGADYLTVMEGCTRLCMALDEGDAPQTARQLDDLFLNLLRGSYSIPLCRDALSFCKNMLQVRCTVYGLLGQVDLDKLCNVEGYLRIEECAAALGPVLKGLCGEITRQGIYTKPVLLAVYYIKNHFREDISLPEIARYAGVNPNYLSGVFRESTGTALRDFITAVRLGQAKAMLCRGGQKIAEIAEAVGFCDAKYFTRTFKKAEGVTPAEYRQAPR